MCRSYDTITIIIGIGECRARFRCSSFVKSNGRFSRSTRRPFDIEWFKTCGPYSTGSFRSFRPVLRKSQSFPGRRSAWPGRKGRRVNIRRQLRLRVYGPNVFRNSRRWMVDGVAKSSIPSYCFFTAERVRNWEVLRRF